MAYFTDEELSNALDEGRLLAYLCSDLTWDITVSVDRSEAGRVIPKSAHDVLVTKVSRGVYRLERSARSTPGYYVVRA